MKSAVKMVCLALFTLLLLMGAAPSALADPVTLNVQPDKVEVGVNYAGSRVTVSGRVPPGSQVLIKVESPERTVGLSKKGRVGGLFYMTVATVNVKGMPGMYKVLSSGKIAGLPAGLQERLGVDPEFRSICSRGQVMQKREEKSIILPPAQAQEYLAGLVRLNTKRGLYSMEDYAVQVESGVYRAVLAVPPDVPRGDSKITVYAVKNGSVLAAASTALPVVNIGLVRSLGNMAQTNAVAYGALCIVVALAAGISIAGLFRLINKLIFKDEGIGAHH